MFTTPTQDRFRIELQSCTLYYVSRRALSNITTFQLPLSESDDAVGRLEATEDLMSDFERVLLTFKSDLTVQQVNKI